MEVQWWLDNIQSATKDIHHRQPDIVLYIDASRLGWGARSCRHGHTAGIWSAVETTKHINVLELLAIKLNLCCLLSLAYDTHIRVMCDNTTAVSYINAMGGSKSNECNVLAKDTLDWSSFLFMHSLLFVFYLGVFTR